jgi:hypothetical protein
VTLNRRTAWWALAWAVLLAILIVAMTAGSVNANVFGGVLGAYCGATLVVVFGIGTGKANRERKQAESATMKDRYGRR